jgi:hypothetical protein
MDIDSDCNVWNVCLQEMLASNAQARLLNGVGNIRPNKDEHKLALTVSAQTLQGGKA